MQNSRQSKGEKVDNCLATVVKNVNKATTTTTSTVIQSSIANSNNKCSSVKNNNGNTASTTTSSSSVTTQNNNSVKISTNAIVPSQNSTPTKSVTETYSEFQPRVTDSSDSDEESVSEVDSFPIDQESIEIPESCSDSCENEEDDNEDINYDDGDEEDSGESGEESGDDAETDQGPQDTKARLEALLEAADEAAQALTRMRGDGNGRENKHLLSRSLLAACSDNDMTAVRKLLGENSTISDGTDDGDSLLSLACSAGYYELAQVLLAMSAQVEDRGQKNDCTPLMEASSAGHADIIELLIKHGADVNAQSSTGNTPLMYACAGGHVAAVKVLLQAGANVEDHNENGHTPLMEAASAGHVSVAKILLEHGAGINTHSNEFKESALTLACYKGHLDMVRFLLEAGADQEHKTDEMHTALMEASMDGHVEVARLLLDSGAQVNMPTDSFESPLTLAACGGHVDLAMLLIERGANIEEVNDEGYTPLMEAAREGHEEMVALLLSQSANINAQTEETQETALTLACCGGFLEVADYLIKHGADIELGASTPLMEAAQEGHIELVRFLLENRANVHAQTQTGDTALAYACENGHTDVAEILLMYGAELEHESEGGRTPLMKACRAGHLCTVKFLIGRGADVNRQTANNDHTPLSLACAGGHQTVVELLLATGADPFHKLKDNSTMLIEAAKGGHITVVQMLLDFPQSLGTNGQPSSAQQNILVNNGLHQMPQIAPVPLKHQHNLLSAQNQSQMMQTPPGLHDVPEAIRASNQFQHQLQNKEMADQPHVLAYNDYMKNNPNSLLDPNSALAAAAAMGSTPTQQENSIIAQMRLLQIQNEGFKDGLMQGLAKAQPGLLNNNSGNTRNGQLIMPQQQQQPGIISNTVSQTSAGGKQKSLLRKNRPNLSSGHYEQLTDVQKIRSQPIGENQADTNDLSEVASILNNFDEMSQDEFMQKWKETLQFYNDGPPPTLLPPSNAYIDLGTPTQGLIYGTSGAGVNFSAAPSQLNTNMNNITMQQFTSGPVQPVQLFPSQQQQPSINNINDSTTNNLDINNTLATFFTDARQPQENAFSLASLSGTQQQEPSNASTTTTIKKEKKDGPSQPITSPGDVSQSTAIADRPKVKPVSKKDGKYINKKSYVQPVLQQQNQNQGQIDTSGASNIQQSQSNCPIVRPSALSSINFTATGAGKQSNILQAASNIVPNPLSVITSNPLQFSGLQQQQQSQQIASPDQALDATSNANQQLTQMPINTWNPKMLHKIAQRLIVDTSTASEDAGPGGIETSNTSSPNTTASSSDDSAEDSPVSPMLNVKSNNNIQLNLELSDVGLAAISSSFCTQLAQVHQHVSNIIQHKPGNNKSDQESEFIETDTDGNMQIFRIDENDTAISSEAVEALYPPITDTFNPVDVTFDQDGNQEPGCNLEWVDCIDEVLNALNGIPVDIPGALQEFAANCSDIDTYANLLGMNTYCKARWAEQWPPQQNQQGGIQSSTSPDTDDIVDVNQLVTTAADDDRQQQQSSNPLIALDHHQLQHQLQQELSFQQLQLLNQLQNQQQPGALPSIPVTLSTQTQNAVLTAIQNQVEQQLQQQATQQATADAQQQTKLVFNKATQSLQLLFELPTVQQGGQAQPPQGAIITQQQQSGDMVSSISQGNQSIAQTQTCPPGTHLGQQTIQVLPPSMLEMQAQVQQHCNQHQVATQTPVTHQNTGGLTIPPLAPRSTMQSESVKLATKAGPKKTEKRLKDKRFPSRPAPAGQQSNINTNINVTPPAVPSGFQFDPAIQAAQFPANAQNVLPDRTIDVDSETDSNHDTALTLACAGGHEELVELLLERGANIEHRDKKGFTPLILAATAGHAKVVEILINRKAELEAQSERTKDTPLSLACSGGRYEVVELLLKHGANKEHRNVSDYTPLSLAASGGYVNIIKMLLQHGAEINSRTGSKLGISPLMLAAMNGHTPAVRLLLDMGSDINAQIETNRNTALTLACFQGRHEVVSLLLDRKANVEHRAKTGLTPLMEAASGGYIEVGRVLLDKGADVNAAPVPSSRDTALTIAADKGHLKFVELLLSRNAAVEVKNKKGNSPLWLAANGGHLGVVEVLFNAGADIDSQDNRKVSCLMAAFRKGHTKVVKWMVNHVSQFPSDQEMTRFISTLSDKDISDKCHECVKVIRAAKETQAKKAYMNASILLRELDMEKNREEQRKAAAAKRRERKKRRKQEKREQQRKLTDDKGSKSKSKNAQRQQVEELEDRDDSDDDSSDSDDDPDEDDLDTIPEPTPIIKSQPITHQPELRQEKEEGDSGIDANSQGSCSSSDVKPLINIDKNGNKRTNKKKKQTTVTTPNIASGSNSNRSSNSPATVMATDTQPLSNSVTEEIKVNRREPQRKQHLERKETNKPQKQTEKENVAPKEDSTQKLQKDTITKPSHQPEPINQKKDYHQQTNNKASYEHYQQPISQRKTVYSRSTVEREEFEVTENVFYNSNTKKIGKGGHDSNSPGKNTSQPIYAKREEGWKEVVSKSSGPRSLPTETKKVQVPTHAISRVIGRAGSNINAIRAATGAHIEVEKQGKVQGDRSITIKGSAEATKQAHHLITILIRDPDVDIIQVLKKEGIGKVTTGGSGSITISTWDKSKPSSTTSSQDGDSMPSKKSGMNVKASSVVSSLAASLTVSSSKTNTSVSSARPTAAKNLFTPSSNVISNTTQVSSTAVRSISSEKRAIASTASQRGGMGTKNTPSYSNAMQVLKNTIKNASAPSFAARVSTTISNSNTDSAKKSDIKSNTKILASPKHGLPAPFTSISSSVSSIAVTQTQSKVIFSQTSSTAETNVVNSTANSSARPVTPIGVNKNLTPTPLLPNTSIASSGISTNNNHVSSNKQSTEFNQNVQNQQSSSQTTGVLRSQIQSNINNNLHQNSQAHEYSLFLRDDSYGSQWDNNQYTASVKAKTYIENEPLVDASKAPGWERGNTISSPVSSKTSSQSTTPPSSVLNQGLNILPSSSSSVIGNQPSQLSVTHTATSQQSYASPTDHMQQNVIKPPAGPIQPPSNLAVQRPNSSNTTNQMRQMQTTSLDTYSLAPGPPGPPQQPQHGMSRGNMYDNYQQPPSNYYSQHDTYGNQSGLGPIGMSRLNPKASAFNSMQQSTAPTQSTGYQSKGQYGMYGNAASSGANYPGGPKISQNNPSYGTQNRGNAPQQPQNGSSMRAWGYQDLGYGREMMGLENGIQQLGIISPSMSPNSMPNGMSGGPMDDTRKTRPIGAERSWKFFAGFGGIGPLEPDNASVGPAPQWGMDATKPPQNQMPLQWMHQPPIGRGFGEEMHGTEHFQPLQVDYQNLMGGPNQQNLNYMYPQYMPNDSMVSAEPSWETDKNTWPGKWTH